MWSRNNREGAIGSDQIYRRFIQPCKWGLNIVGATEPVEDTGSDRPAQINKTNTNVVDRTYLVQSMLTSNWPYVFSLLEECSRPVPFCDRYLETQYVIMQCDISGTIT